MIVTVFRSRLRPEVRDEYVALVDRMTESPQPCRAIFRTRAFSPTTASG